MRIPIRSLFLIATLLSCASGRCEITNALKFYIVSEQRFEGGKSINATSLPKPGYISVTPDLVVTNLAEVFRVRAGGVDIVDGKSVPVRPSPILAVAFGSADAEHFTALTTKALGKRLLMAIGDRPLNAPLVVAPIENGRISIDFATERELEQAQDELKKLIRP